MAAVWRECFQQRLVTMHRLRESHKDIDLHKGSEGLSRTIQHKLSYMPSISQYMDILILAHMIFVSCRVSGFVFLLAEVLGLINPIVSGCNI